MAIDWLTLVWIAFAMMGSWWFGGHVLPKIFEGIALAIILAFNIDGIRTKWIRERFCDEARDHR